MASSSLMAGWEYDVFLSFRAEDTRINFMDHLYVSLSDLGFRTFIDDAELLIGNLIPPELMKAINESKIVVIVFSKNYASSPWCLDVLVEILKFERIILPIFYNVKRSDVRNQAGYFEKAFTRHEGVSTADKVGRWREALKKAADISGLDLEDAADGYESRLVNLIVQEISGIYLTKYDKVGIDSRADKLIKMLNDGSNDKSFVGICGIGGIGKTTVAKVIFNRIYKEFETSCFIENVKEKSKKNGLVELQKELLKETLKDFYVRISSSDEGVNEIKDRLRCKKTLIVLDDVDDEKQLLNLAGIGQNWFGPESKIIITTRNKLLLTKHDVKICEAELLHDNEALELFSWHAFKWKFPKPEYQELSYRLINYTNGVPLALRVLGSHLYGRRIQDWVSELDELKNNPHKQIQDVLKRSYNGLDKNQKSIFLDIACFFKGYDKNCAMDCFASSESQSVFGIEVLIERSLITISEHNEFLMHDLIQEMGREIVCNESKDPGKRSRLWRYKDINQVFFKNTVTKNIEGIVLPKFGSEGLIVSPNAFSKMNKLRILIISNVQLLGCPTSLSNQLRCIEWEDYPGEYLPLPRSLVQLQLSHSHIKNIQKDKWFFEKLKVIDLSYNQYLVETLSFYGMPCLEELHLQHCETVVEVEFPDMMKNLTFIDLSDCKKLRKTPNVSQLPCLEELYFGYCRSLVEVDSSIVFHKRLVELEFCYCENLKSLATKINLKSLKWLDLEGCSKLEKFPEIVGDMNCLEDLNLSGTAIKELPSSIIHLRGLTNLWLSECTMPISIREMKNLRLDGSRIKDLPPSEEHPIMLEYLKMEASGSTQVST